MTNPPSAYLHDAAAPTTCTFHRIGERGRLAYVDGVRDILVTGGHFYMLPLGEAQHEAGHSRHATIDAVTIAFASGFRVDPVTVDTTTDPDGLPARLVASPGSEAK